MREQWRSKHRESEPDLLGFAMALVMLVAVYAGLHWWDTHIKTLMSDTGAPPRQEVFEDDAAVVIIEHEE